MVSTYVGETRTQYPLGTRLISWISLPRKRGVQLLVLPYCRQSPHLMRMAWSMSFLRSDMLSRGAAIMRSSA
eukprot:11747968-Heterocapsa_arctica.AAC.1